MPQKSRIDAPDALHHVIEYGKYQTAPLKSALERVQGIAVGRKAG
jgi:hypothetical protein